MSFWDHLDVLRGTLIRSFIAVCILTVIGLSFKEALFSIILAPADGSFVLYRLLGMDFNMKLINIDISAQFFVHLKASAAAGFIVAFPYIIWELWKFISPALYEHEKRAAKTAFALSSLLFYLGIVVGYFVVLPFCLQFFMGYTVSPDIENSISLDSYMSMFASMVLLIGLAFEFPAVIVLLSKAGIVNRELLKKGRKYAFVILLVIAALITPADPFSMFVLGIPLYLLYELAIKLCS